RRPAGAVARTRTGIGPGAPPRPGAEPVTGRIDVVSIFPQYLEPLELSLVGKARREGLLDITVHDLRSWTTDTHRTVDDTPFGGGAGMVMRPDVWGRALDEVFDAEHHHGRILVMPSPAGE